MDTTLRFPETWQGPRGSVSAEGFEQSHLVSDRAALAAVIGANGDPRQSIVWYDAAANTGWQKMGDVTKKQRAMDFVVKTLLKRLLAQN